MDEQTMNQTNESEQVSEQNNEAQSQTEASKTLLGGAANGTSSPESAAESPSEDQNGEQTQEEIPESYDLKAPEGMTIDSEALAEFTPVAKELKLTNSQAQKLSDLYSSRMQKIQDQQYKAYWDQVAKWKDEVTSDPVIGGPQLQSTINDCQRAAKTYDTDGQFVKVMDSIGYGNHPAVIKFLAAVGKSLKEDKADARGASNRGGKTQDWANKVFYDKS